MAGILLHQEPAGICWAVVRALGLLVPNTLKKVLVCLVQNQMERSGRWEGLSSVVVHSLRVHGLPLCQGATRYVPCAGLCVTTP